MFFHIDGVCTTKPVKTCVDREACETFKSQPVEDEFHKLYPGAYAEVCAEKSTGENCIYTDVVYDYCGAAKGAELIHLLADTLIKSLYFSIEAQSTNEICITLSNGDVACAESEFMH